MSKLVGKGVAALGGADARGKVPGIVVYASESERTYRDRNCVVEIFKSQTLDSELWRSARQINTLSPVGCKMFLFRFLLESFGYASTL